MGFIEFARINEEGVSWVDLSTATPEELLEIEIGLFQEGAI
jgi:predicted HTH domain antitoxin